MTLKPRNGLEQLLQGFDGVKRDGDREGDDDGEGHRHEGKQNSVKQTRIDDAVEHGAVVHAPDVAFAWDEDVGVVLQGKTLVGSGDVVVVLHERDEERVENRIESEYREQNEDRCEIEPSFPVVLAFHGRGPLLAFLAFLEVDALLALAVEDEDFGRTDAEFHRPNVDLEFGVDDGLDDLAFEARVVAE